MKERSGMPYDVVAFEADELAHALDPYEEGIFQRLLRKAWMNGSIPNDLTTLADLCRVRPSSFKKAWVKVSKLWQPMTSDLTRLQNKKQESERIFLDFKREQSRQAGKLSAKYRKTKDRTSTTVQRKINDRSTSLPSPPLPLASSLLKDLPNTDKSPFLLDMSIPSEPVLEFGEFRWAKMTQAQHDKLKTILNGNLDRYISRFDLWLEELKNPKTGKLPRKYQGRQAYLTIQKWFSSDYPDGVPEFNAKPKTPPLPHKPTEAEIQFEMDRYRKIGIK